METTETHVDPREYGQTITLLRKRAEAAALPLFTNGAELSYVRATLHGIIDAGIDDAYRAAHPST